MDNARRALVAASFDGGSVTVGTLEDAAQRAAAHLRERYRDPEHLKNLLAIELRAELLAHEALRRGYDKHPQVQHAMREEAVRLLLEALTTEAFASITPAELRAAERAHKVDESPRRRASLIEAATLEQAQALLKRARGLDAKGFRTLARELAQDEGSRTRGGDLGYFNASGAARDGSTVASPALAKAVFALKEIGDLTVEPIKLEKGYGIAMLMGQLDAEVATPEQRKALLQQELANERGADPSALVETLTKQYGVETHPERLDLIALDSDTELSVEIAEESQPTP